MRREVKTVESVEWSSLAETFFLDMPGMTEEGIEIGKQYSQGKPIRLIRVVYDAQDIKDKRCYLQKETLYVDSECFLCEEFEQLDEKKLKGLCIYMVTCEEAESTGDLLEDYYLHAWQTACLDAAREKIKSLFLDEIQRVDKSGFNDDNKMKKIEVTNSYGPGFYGMDIVELERFHSLVEGTEIGVTMMGQMLYPIKTCTGLYLAMEQGGMERKAPCEVCIMDGACELCSYSKRERHN